MQKAAPRLDAILVLGGNITQKADGTFAPSTYADSDQYGMLGGRMRVFAAVWMYLAGEVRTFVFSTGTSEKTKATFGPSVPTEAYLYSEDFKRILHELQQPLPTIILEDRSKNTVGNIRECFEIIRRHPEWHKVGVMSADFHIPRVKALCELIQDKEPIEADLEFIGAESTLKRLKPGMYDAEIDAAYASPEGKKRLRNENQGLRDMEEGKYYMGEFQLQKS
jgi:hypothetical protein